MGFISKGLIGNLLGMGEKKSPTQAPTAAASTTQTPDQIDEERRRRLVALNASNSNGQMTPAGGAPGNPALARKALLGL